LNIEFKVTLLKISDKDLLTKYHIDIQYTFIVGKYIIYLCEFSKEIEKQVFGKSKTSAKLSENN